MVCVSFSTVWENNYLKYNSLRVIILLRQVLQILQKSGGERQCLLARISKEVSQRNKPSTLVQLTKNIFVHGGRNFLQKAKLESRNMGCDTQRTQRDFAYQNSL